MLLTKLYCRACNSKYIVELGSSFGQRSLKLHEAFICLDCKSIFWTSGYKETNDQKKIDFEYVMDHFDHHNALHSRLFHEIISRAPHISNVCDIGHGSGTMMLAAKNFGREVCGFEFNEYCTDFVSNKLKLNSYNELFEAKRGRTFDLITSIMVFEHIEAPRQLFGEMVASLNEGGCIVLSVPFVERENWPFLRKIASSEQKLPGDPFYDNDVHINHFTRDGLIKMGADFGAIKIDCWFSKDVVDKSPASYPIIMYYF